MSTGVPGTRRPKEPRGPAVLSGMRPTGKLHLGHLHGALTNWLDLQNQYRCFFFIADWHAFTTDYASPERIPENAREMMVEWLSIGLDPERCVLFRQSDIKEHAELQLILSMITPLAWLERNPTYKEQIEQLASKDLSTHGFLGYPVLQAADILMYKASFVPVGIDQAPHVELTREIARKFNHLYGSLFPEPDVLLTNIPKLPGLDGRKMSKSYGNAVYLSDPPEIMEEKLKRMATDPARVRRSDPGEPEKCPAFNLHRIYCTESEIQEVSHGCRSASIGCVDCKMVMIKHVVENLGPYREKRSHYERHPGEVRGIIARGNHKAAEIAASTMAEVRAASGLASDTTLK